MDGKQLARIVGRKLKQAREALKLSQAEAAERIGVTQEAYGAWERGVRLMPTNYLPELQRALNQPPLWFLDLGDWEGLTDEELLLVQTFRGIRTPAIRQHALEVLAAQQRAESAMLADMRAIVPAKEHPEGPEVRSKDSGCRR
jgi:transcriptional regulator with XRE-family HTH domain